MDPSSPFSKRNPSKVKNHTSVLLMVHIIFISGAVSLLLVGCGTVEERRERAEDVIDTASDYYIEGIKQAQEGTENLKKTISGAAEKLQATALEIQDRTDQLQEGVGKVIEAVETGKEGMTEVKEAFDVSGEE